MQVDLNIHNVDNTGDTNPYSQYLADSNIYQGGTFAPSDIKTQLYLFLDYKNGINTASIIDHFDWVDTWSILHLLDILRDEGMIE